MTSRTQSEHPLKAIVFADNCGAEKSLSLAHDCNLLNLPTLSWQLGTLARHGVKEAIVLSAQPIQNVYTDPLSRMNVTQLSSSSWRGEGDAIRDLEARDDLRPVDDFVLVRYGTIFNVNVSQLVVAHKRRREADRNWLVTSVFRKGAGSASTGLVLAVETGSGTLVKYNDDLRENGLSIDVHAENSGLAPGGRVDVLSNVLDIGLDVCAPEFLLEFRENFYYDNVRAYIKEKLDGGEAEVFGNRMYAHFLSSKIGEYGSRIMSLASLMQATSDVLNGWMSPVSAASISGTRGETDPSHMSTEFILEKCAVGKDVSIGVGCTIMSCVIGNDVTIGCDVTINNSILMDGVKIADSCVIEQSILGPGCEVGVSSTLSIHTFLDADVRIGDWVDVLPSHSLVTLQQESGFTNGENDSDDTDEEIESSEAQNGSVDTSTALETWDESFVGEEGKGRLFSPEIAACIDRFFIPRARPMVLFESDGEDELEEQDDFDDEEVGSDESSSGQEEEDVETDERVSDRENNGDAEIAGVTRDLAGASLENDPEKRRIEQFNEEALETMERADSEGVEVRNTILEINSLKLVYQCSFVETLVGVIRGVTLTVLNRSNEANLYGNLDSALERNKDLISKFNRTDDTAHLVQVATGLANTLRDKGICVMYVFKVMYEKDMLEEDGILGWASEERQRVSSGDCDGALLATLSPFLEWLEEAEEED